MINDLNEYVLSCDWLQIHVSHPDNYLQRENIRYLFKPAGQSRVFREIFDIVDIPMDIVIGQYCTGANEAFMSRSEGVFKFSNSQLYVHEDVKAFAEKFLKCLDFKFIGITRFDIAMDFEQFANGRKPGNFIRDFVCEKVLNSKSIKWGIIAEQVNGKHSYQTLHVGAKTSNVCWKLYNKTLELKNNFKPWIHNFHKKHFDMKSDIWRLEFTLFSMNSFFKTEGKEFKFHSLEMLEYKNMHTVFVFLFKKYCRFKKNEPGKRLTRMKDIVLWDFKIAYCELKKCAQNPLLKESGRSEKIFIKKLEELNSYLRGFDENFDYTKRQMLGKLISLTGLDEWVKRKGYEYEGNETYMNDAFEYKQIKANDLLLNLEFETAIDNSKQYRRRIELNSVV